MEADQLDAASRCAREILADLRAHGGASLGTLRRHPGCRFLLLHRLHQFAAGRSEPWWRPLRWVARAALIPMRRRYDIPPSAHLGPGLFLSPHAGGIVINGDASVGPGCHLNHGVTIGGTPRGRRKGAPVLGTGVYVGAGAAVLGRVTVGSGAVVGANCVVTEDVAPGAVVAAPRPIVISFAGTAGYRFTDAG